ncbi:hypothetical protein ZWY2020_054463, partial [Hordeum vulgare]
HIYHLHALLLLFSSKLMANPNINPFPTGPGWMAMLLGSARGNHQLFIDYMEMANRYSSMQEMVAAEDVVRARVMQEEKNNMHRVHGVTMPSLLPIAILLWAMKEADSANP